MVNSEFVIPSEARNLALDFGGQHKIRARFLASLGMTMLKADG
jgi:hypothetical protein